MKNRARTLIYSTALPPAMAAAAIAALTIIENAPELCAKPLAKAHNFTSLIGLPEAQSPIVPLIVGAPEAALKASRKLAEEGFLVTPIRPPTVPQGTARLRFAFTAMHPDGEIARLAQAVRSLGEFSRSRKIFPGAL
jgi:8-amino-7-oxononanoate synthase